MTQYIIRRLIQSLFIIWGCATLVFFMLRMIPGDPVVQMLGPEYTPEAAERSAHKLGLDEPLHVQYVRWFGNVLTGDLGGSIASGETVVDSDRDRAAEDPQSGRALVPDRAHHRRAGRDHRRAAAEQRLRLRRQRRRLRRRQHAELLVRHHPDPDLRRPTALAAGHRLLRDRRRMASASGSSG